jgi:hypothetical protein
MNIIELYTHKHKQITLRRCLQLKNGNMANTQK